MTTFHKTTWDKVKPGDTILVPASGSIWEVVIDELKSDGLYIVAAYHYLDNSRRYEGVRFTTNAVYAATS